MLMSVAHLITQRARSSIKLCLSLCLIGCGSQRVPSVEETLNPLQLSQELIDLSNYTLITDELLACDPHLADQLDSKSAPLVLLTNHLNLQEKLRMNSRQTELWLDLIEARGGDLALKIASDNEISPENLERSRDLLIDTLDHMGRRFRKPPVRAWHVDPQSPSKDRQSSRSMHTAWLDLAGSHLLAPKRLTSSERSHPHVKQSDDLDCVNLLEQISDRIRSTKSSPSLSDLYAQKINSGARLVRAERGPISSTCLKLFDFTPSLFSELNEQESLQRGSPKQLRWHLVMRQTHKRSGEELPRYLTLPLPEKSTEIPTWREDGPLTKLWNKRHLWWGASSCWQELTQDEISLPLPEMNGRWVHQVHYRPSSAKAQGMKSQGENHRQRLYITDSPMWRLPIRQVSLMTKSRAYLLENTAKLPILLQGAVERALEDEALLSLRQSDAQIAGLWMGSTAHNPNQASAYVGIHLLPLIAYESLLILSGDLKSMNFAYQERSLGSVLYIPRYQHDHLLFGSHSQGISELITKHSSQLKRGDMISQELSPVEAWRLLGTESLFNEPHIILRERLSRYLKSPNTLKAHQLINTGGMIEVEHGPLLGRQRLRVALPPTLIP